MHVTSFRSFCRAALRVALFSCAAGMMMLQTVHADSAAPSSSEHLMIVVDGREIKFQVEVARTLAQKSKGLMFRTALGVGHGMLFPYDGAQEVAMWMRNTYISLDMLFIRADGVIHRIEANTEPFSERVIQSNGEVTAVLEIAGGEAKRLGIDAGDVVRHAAFETAAP